MKNLLAFEFRKLFRSKLFYILLGVITANILLSLLLEYSLSKEPDAWVAAPTAFSLLKSVGGGQNLIPLSLYAGIFIALFTLEDYSCGAIKTVYGKGYCRGAVFTAKFFVAELVTLFFFALACGLTFGCGMLFFQKGTAPARLAVTLLVQLAIFLAYGAIYFWFAALLKKIGSSIAAIVFVPSVFRLIVSLLGEWIQKTHKNFDLAKYTLTSALQKLTVNEITTKTLVFCLILALCYGAVFTIWSYLLHRKREI